MSNITQSDADLNQQILSGKAMDAFEKYYADNVVMQENSEPEVAGKDANRKREIEFFSNVQEFHGAKLEKSVTDGNTSFSQWWMDVTFKGGHRATYSQVAVREWKDGKIAHERFFYAK